MVYSETSKVYSLPVIISYLYGMIVGCLDV